jgi:hypothetical protein
MSNAGRQRYRERDKVRSTTTVGWTEAEREKRLEEQERIGAKGSLGDEGFSTKEDFNKGETEMAENARETLESANASLRHGAEQARESLERETDEVTNAFGRLAEIGTDYVRRTAEVNIDTFQKMAIEVLNLQSKAAEWMRGTPLAAICDAQARAGRKLVETTASSTRNAWRSEAGR